MQNKTAVIDLDDTIIDLCPHLVRVLNKITGKSLKPSDWTVYNTFELYGVSQQEYLEICKQENVLEEADPIILTKEVIDKLYQKNYDVIFLTARGWHEDARKITLEWLARHNIYYDHLHIVPYDQSKCDYLLNTIGKVDVIVDDNPTHISNFIENKVAKQIFLIDQPWNLSYIHLDPYRIHHIVDILRKL